MDPATAIAVAAAALQFLDSGLQALSVCKQIRDSAEGVTERNKELELHSKTLLDLSAELKISTSQSNNTAGRRIKKLAMDCVASSGRLLDVLKKVQDASKSRLFGTVKATFIAMRDQRVIEKLQYELEERRLTLDSALIQDIKIKVDVVSFQQTQQFKTLNAVTQSIAIRLAGGHAEIKKMTEETHAILNKMQKQNQAASEANAASHSKTQAAIAALHNDMAKTFSDLKLSNIREELMQSLFYPEHILRRETVKAPWQSTFTWILEPSMGVSEQAMTADRQRRWIFADWLKSKDPVYWITGKAGSGKSTLMAYILNDDRMQEYLNQWAGQSTVHVISFFFWRAGTSLQRSILGLLRSLLYQLLEQGLDVTESLARRFPWREGQIAAWTEKHLAAMLKLALTCASAEPHFWFFIDGLDESEGEADELWSTISELQDSLHVKFCVSSRPEIAFSRRLSRQASLRMEQLNRADIQKFVTDRLHEYRPRPGFVDAIVERASGVFLWSRLATQFVIKGIQCGDDDMLLFERLSQLPAEMSDLFDHMAKSVDEVHKRRLGFFFRAKKLNDFHCAVELIAASLMQGDITWCQDFWKFCEQVELQVAEYSCGMLEIKRPSAPYVLPSGAGNVVYLDKHENCVTWALPEVERAGCTDKLAGTLEQRCFDVASRCAISNHEFFERQKKRERCYIEWVHRSAFDYIFSKGSGRSGHFLELPSEDVVARALITGSMKMLIAAPNHSYHGEGKTSLSTFDRVEQIIEFVHKFKDTLSHDKHKILDETLDLLRRFSLNELNIIDRWGSDFAFESLIDHESIPQEFLEFHLKDVSFWMLCLRHHSHHLSLNMSRIKEGKYAVWLLTTLVAALYEVAPARGITISALTSLTEWLDAHQSTSRHGSLVFKSVGGTDLGWTISWASAADNDLDFLLEPAIIYKLSTAWKMYCPFVSRSHARQITTPKQREDATALLLRALGHWDVRVGKRERGNSYTSGRIRVQAPPEISLLQVGFRIAPQGTIRQLQNIPFRLVCAKRRQDTRIEPREIVDDLDVVALFTMNTALNNWLLQDVSETFEDLCERECFQEALYADIWANTGDQLTAWQQLFLLACVRTAPIGHHRREDDG